MVSVPLTEQLAHEYRRFRADQPSWIPLQPPAAVRAVAMVEADEEPEAEAAGGGGGGGGGGGSIGGGSAGGGGGGGNGGGGAVEVGLPQTHEGGYPTRPTLHGRKLAFISEGDIWLGEIELPSPPGEIPPPAGEAAAAGAAPPAAPVCCARLTADAGCVT